MTIRDRGNQRKVLVVDVGGADVGFDYNAARSRAHAIVEARPIGPCPVSSTE
ncbi:hypothetical protein ABI214_22010 [Prescottella soli]|uniref:Uncharacterized protein n=1 Tax=Prescottella soli TaxID=1543852 RepID=A0ABW9FSK6_9NOCA